MFVALVLFFFILMFGGAAYLLTQASVEPWKKAAFAGAALGSLALKLLLATRGHNFDLDSYGIVASLVLHGKSVYANTSRFNYAPLWSWVVAGLEQFAALSPVQGRETYHVTVAAFLGMTDVALAAVLSTQYRYGAGIFLLCCPAGILLTGYHSQFENFALLAGLVGWLLIRRSPTSRRRLVLAALVQGLSLVIKHVLFLFPLWLFFWKELGSRRRRAAYVLISYGVFALSFAPWMFDPASRQGIIQNVFLYRSEFTYSLGQLLASVSFLALFPKQESTILMLIWVAIVAVAGNIVARRKADLFTIYLLVMFTFSPALRDQYLAIPLLACAILYASWPGWALAAIATLTLLSSPFNLALFSFRCYFTVLVSTQVCAAVLLWTELRRAKLPRSGALPPREFVRNALALGLGSVAAVSAILLVKSFVLL